MDRTMKTRSLLSKTLTLFLICTVCIFLLTTPLFYMLTKYFYAEDMIDIIESVESGQGIPPLDLERDIMGGMMLQFMLIFIVISLSLFITMRFTTKRLWQPFNNTLKKTEQFNLAQGDIPSFIDTDIREFNRLNQSIEKLIRKDKETFRIQKEFTENASHELQTPLAIIRSKLDLLMQEDMNKRQMKLVSDLYQLTTRMGHLNRNLLLLAKIENEQYSEQESIDLSAFIKQLIPIYNTLRNQTIISFHERHKHGVSILANTVLLECMINNLVVNAIRHTPNEGYIILTLYDNKLTIVNPANGHALSQEDIFHRFRKGNMENGGNGLGLSIVKAVCDYHEWDIKYEFVDNTHSFTVTFNKQS